jgi:DNA topoisomerase-3
MREIADMTRQIVERAKNYELDNVPGDYATLATPCPNCGGVVQENYKRFACTKCDFSITKIPGGRQLEVAEAEQLLRERTIGPLQGFRSRLGRPFAAILKLTPEHKLEFDFGQPGEDESAEPVDFGDQQPLGPCPKCGADVYEHGMSYVCEKSVGPSRSCDFRSGKIILQQEVARDQMSKLLAEGRTDLLQGFVSSRTRRRFKAFLVRGADGKIGFEFEPRPARPARAGAAGGAAEAAAGSGERRSAASKTTARSAAPAKGAAAKKAGAAKVPAARTPALAAPATKPAVKKPAVKKAASKKSAAKKAPTGRSATTPSSASRAPATKAAAPRKATSAKATGKPTAGRATRAAKASKA